MLTKERFPSVDENLGDFEDEKSPQPRHGVGIGGWIIVAFLTLVLAVVIRVFFVQSYRIPSESMFPTLEVGDHILVNKLGYGYDLFGKGDVILKYFDPSRYDVVVFKHEMESADGVHAKHKEYESYIKRVVGLPGETVVIRNDRVYINGRHLHELQPVINERTPENEARKSNYGPVVLGTSEYFVLGDNRVNSEDSRYFGPIDRKLIEGRAIIIYWSWNENGLSGIRWQRIGQLIR